MKILQSIQEKAFIKWLLWQSRPGVIKNIIGRAHANYSNKNVQSSPAKGAGKGETVEVAAIQCKLFLVNSIEDYVLEMYRLTKKAAGRGAELIVFPEDNATHLMGLLPGMDKLDGNTDLESALSEMAGPEVKVADIFTYLGPLTRQVFHHTFSELARTFQVDIMAGSAIMPSGEKNETTINQSFLYDFRGKLVGSQTKAHLLPLENQWGICAGDKLEVFSTRHGQVAFPICMDATYFETFRILSLLGAELILLPTANPDEYNYYKALRGIWPRVQENIVYGVQSCLVGEAFGIVLTGRAGIFAPMDMTPAGDGVINQAESPTEEAIVTGSLDMELLRQMRKSEAKIYNLELYKKYFPHIYTEMARQNQ